MPKPNPAKPGGLIRRAFTAKQVGQGVPRRSRGEDIPGLAYAQFLRGYLAEMNYDLTAAEMAYRKAIELSPKTPYLHFARASVLVRLGRMEEAVKEADRSVTLAPEQVEMRILSAEIHTALGRPEDAIRNYRAALKQKPNLQEVSIFLGANLDREEGMGRGPRSSHPAFEKERFIRIGPLLPRAYPPVGGEV